MKPATQWLSMAAVLLLYSVATATAEAAPKKPNPYQRGCLYSKGLTSSVRVCGSDDPPSALAEGICREPPFDYAEVRIQPGDWESSFFSTWILQIVLTEILHVPVSLEQGDPVSSIDLYHPEMRLDYHSDYKHYLTAMENAHKFGGDCSKAVGDGYEMCAHFVPEVWSANSNGIQDLVYAEQLEPPQSLNMLAQQGWYIPKFTAQRDPSLLSYLGMQGEENRQKLADTFKRPQTWQQYCDHVSPTLCSTPDNHAQRAPNTTEEGRRMYVEDLYQGYFLATDQNNCTLHPDTCTGHFVQYPCQWRSNVPTQLHYLDIAMDARVDPDHSFPRMVETWRAAKANQENVIVYWWSPELFMFEMAGSDFEFTPVSMPLPTVNCLKHIGDHGQHCEADPQDRLGPPDAVCGQPAKVLHSLMSTTVFKRAMSGPKNDLAIASPAHTSLSQFELTELQLSELFASWNEIGDPRQAVCDWVADNQDYLQPFIPRSYPRIPIKKNPRTPLMYGSTILGGFVVLLVLLTMVLVYENRACRPIQHAQIEFLGFLLVGSLLICLGAIVMGAPPSSASCIMEIWLVNLGYTLELVPLVVKVAAVNHITQVGRSMKRVKIKREFLFGVVLAITVVVVIFLICWTILDPPQLTNEYELTETINDDGETTVLVLDICASESMVWRYLSVGWNGFLLACTTILAIQMRKVKMEGFNETSTLALLVYSHMVFVLLRVVTYLLASEDISQYTLARCQSMIFSLDTLATILIYFVPKFMALNEQPQSSIHISAGSFHSTYQGSTSGSKKTALPVPTHLRSQKHTASTAETQVPQKVPAGEEQRNNGEDKAATSRPTNKFRVSKRSSWIGATVFEFVDESDGIASFGDIDSISSDDGGKESFHGDDIQREDSDDALMGPLLERNRELEDEVARLKEELEQLKLPKNVDQG